MQTKIILPLTAAIMLILGCNIQGSDRIIYPDDASALFDRDGGSGANPDGSVSDAGQQNGGQSNGGPDGGSGNSGSATTCQGATFVTGGPRWVGRVDSSNPSSVRSSWQGAGVNAVVSGTTIAVRISADVNTYFQPVIDGVAGSRFGVRGTDQVVTIGSGLRSCNHVVELYRETESSQGISTFLGFAQGTVVGAPVSNGRLVEIIGDSISAGYGNLGSESHPNWSSPAPCSWSAQNSSWYATFAAVAGHSLNAEVSTIASSGWGLYQDRNGNRANVMPNVYENALGVYDVTPWPFQSKASAVVINLGTNDYQVAFNAQEYTNAGINFVAKIRTHYPDAWIILAIGPMLTSGPLAQVVDAQAAIVRARNNAGDNQVTSISLGIQNMGSNGEIPTGCDWHPSVTDHQRMAAILRAKLQSVLAW